MYPARFHVRQPLVAVGGGSLLGRSIPTKNGGSRMLARGERVIIRLRQREAEAGKRGLGAGRGGNRPQVARHVREGPGGSVVLAPSPGRRHPPAAPRGQVVLPPVPACGHRAYGRAGRPRRTHRARLRSSCFFAGAVCRHEVHVTAGQPAHQDVVSRRPVRRRGVRFSFGLAELSGGAFDAFHAL